MNDRRATLRSACSHPVANMIDPSFAHFAPVNGFVQCVIRGADAGRERMRRARYFGTTPVL
ncbi:hypothetical protein [Burkholderia sp. BCC0044]|uniref:hypothetical protein n=1 Tax=Burkholderia sp. BCC0044 TaxID=2676295 RepID=UPI00158BF276|nr:hypothetical protein [Burkholderia sp. BCC0044]